MHYVFSSSPINHIATCKTIGIKQVLKHIGNDAASLLYYLFITPRSGINILGIFLVLHIKDTCTLAGVIW